MNIRTKRLDLLPGTEMILSAELRGSTELGHLLRSDMPSDWPPPLYDSDAVQWALDQLKAHAGFRDWGFRYFILDDGVARTAVGAGGFKGPPVDGVVEIGYSVVPSFQRQGIAIEAVGGMIDYARSSRIVHDVVAHTLPDLLPSIGVLEKAGFKPDGDGPEPGVVRFRCSL